MKLVDVNLFLYAYGAHLPHHRDAKSWLEEAFNDTEPIGIAIAVAVSFVRLVTDARVFRTPLSATQACATVSEWIEHPLGSLLVPADRHWDILSRLVTQAQARGPLVPDAHLAATAIEHGATLYTHDRDFSRFPGLRVVYPLPS